MNYLGTIKIEFKDQDDVEARKAMAGLERLLDEFVFNEINKGAIYVTPFYKLQEVFENKPPRGIKLK
jgi:hypothetical protein